MILVNASEYVIKFNKGYKSVQIFRKGQESKGALCWNPRFEALGIDFSKAENIISKSEKVQGGTQITLSGNSDIAEYKACLFISNEYQTIIKTWVDVKLKESVDSLTRLGSEPEFSYIQDNEEISPNKVFYFDTPVPMPVKRWSWRTDLNQFVFFGDKNILNSTVMYYCNFTELNDYFINSGTSMFYSIECEDHEDIVVSPSGARGSAGNGTCIFGTRLPDPQKALKANGKWLRISSAVLSLKPGVPPIWPAGESGVRFINSYSDIFYNIISLPIIHHDWKEYTFRLLDELKRRKGGEGAELNFTSEVNFNINSYMRFYQRFIPEKFEVLKNKGFSRFMEHDRPDYVNDKGSKGGFGWYKNREEAKMVDFWQAYLWPLLQACEFAEEYDNQKLKEIVLDRAQVLIDTARSTEYVFAVLVDVNRGVNVESGYDYDYGVTGGYVYIMVKYYQMTGNNIYLEEAIKAADKLYDYGFSIGFELNVTSASAYGLLLLYKITGNEKYLKDSYTQVAVILKHIWLFNPQYGRFNGRTIFMMTSCRANLDYSNPAEEALLIR